MSGDPEARPLGEALVDIEEAMPQFARWLYGMVRSDLGERVLDAGAGIGTYSGLMIEDGRSVVSLESVPQFVAWMRVRFAGDQRVTVLDADLAATTGLPAFELVDSAVCLNVLEHVEDDVLALRNMRERVAPGGRLIALVPAHPGLFNTMDRHLGHFRRYTRRNFVARLADGGWVVERSFYVNLFGVPGWFVAGSLLKRRSPGRDLAAVFDRLLPIFAVIERTLARGALGLSLVASCRRADSVPSVPPVPSPDRSTRSSPTSSPTGGRRRTCRSRARPTD